MDLADCPVCGEKVESREIERHVNNHFEQEQDEQVEEDEKLAKLLSEENRREIPRERAPSLDELARQVERALNEEETSSEEMLRLIEGADGEESSRVRMTGHTMTWSAPMVFGGRPQPRYLCSDVMVGESVYLFGGFCKVSRRSLNDMYRFDLRQMTWHELFCTGDVPPKRNAACMVDIGDNKIILFGGTNCQEDQIYNDLFQLDLGY